MLGYDLDLHDHSTQSHPNMKRGPLEEIPQQGMCMKVHHFDAKLKHSPIHSLFHSLVYMEHADRMQIESQRLFLHFLVFGIPLEDVK